MSDIEHNEEGPFPEFVYPDPASFLEGYSEKLRRALSTIDRNSFNEAVALIENTFVAESALFVCGNGGSASISNHLLCDYVKGVRTDTALRPRVRSLSGNVELISALANDLSYEKIFSYQLESMASRGDVLLSISSSGNSPNVLEAVTLAQTIGVKTIAMTGFDGGKLRSLADIKLHIAAPNYGIVEDCHSILMHAMAQNIRHRHVDPRQLRTIKF